MLVNSYWRVLLALLVLSSTSADVLAKKQHFWASVSVSVLGAFGWALLLRGEAPYTRSIVVFSVANYVLAAIAGYFLFQDALTPFQWAMAAVGLVVIVSLS